jgi:hypothetical protein
LTQTVRDDVSRRASELLERRFRPSSEQSERARVHGFNCPTDGFAEWRGSSFYLCVRYRTPAEEEFVVRTTRLKHLGLGRFELAYLRHTDRWQPVYSGLKVKECFEGRSDDEGIGPRRRARQEVATT